MIGSEQALLRADASANLRRGATKSKKRQEVATSIAGAIPIRFLSCEGGIDTHTCGLFADIFLDMFFVGVSESA